MTATTPRVAFAIDDRDGDQLTTSALTLVCHDQESGAVVAPGAETTELWLFGGESVDGAVEQFAQQVPLARGQHAVESDVPTPARGSRVATLRCLGVWQPSPEQSRNARWHLP